MTADGSSMALRPGFRDLGDVVAHAVQMPEDGALPTLEQAKDYLREALSAVREHDQRSNDAIVEYIHACTGWTSHTRAGLSNLHYYIATVLTRPDGGLTHIEIDHAMPNDRSNTKENSKDIRAHLIRQALGGEPDREIADDEVNAYVVASAQYATLRQLTPRAVQLLREHAAEGSSDFEIASLRYRNRPVVEMMTTMRGEEVPTYGSDPSWMRDVLSHEITHGTIYLQDSVPTEDVEELIHEAQVYARKAVVEQKTAGDEYHQLVNRYRYDSNLTDEQRAVMAQRMQEIMVLNGAPADAHFLEWYYVIPRALNERIPDTATIPLVEWGEGVHKALIEHLRNTGLYLYNRGVSARLMATAAIAAQLTSASAEPKAIGEFG